MATLIPNIVPSGTPSSEERVFKKLKNDADASEWTVMHSLGLSQRGKKKPYGEIDFVLIIPKLGVVCLEVKGGEISCKAGRWYTTDKYGETHEMKKSPFIQVREGMNALRNAAIEEIGSSFKKCNFYTIVVFPSSDCPPITPEFKEDEVIDASVLGGKISSLIVQSVKSQCNRFDWDQGKSLRDPSEMKELINFLRPDFELKISRPARIRRDREDLISLTKEQFKFIEGCSENKRCLVKGAAGTGKTTLAIEALKLVESVDKRGAFLCFNNVFGGWIQKELEALKIDCAYAGGIYEAMILLIKESSFYSEYCDQRNNLENSKELFEELIPKFAMEAILETGDQLDYIIIDEGQDILKPHILDVMDIWLRGGLKKGNWFIFGDFHNQAIYTETISGVDLIECLEKYVSSYAAFKLSQNCRNTKRIAETTSQFSGFLDLPYTVSQIEGEPVQRTFWKSQKEAIEKLQIQLEKLLEDGCAPSDIAILSPKKFKDSSVSGVHINGYDIIDISNAFHSELKPESIVFSTIHSFKGLESAIVLLTDIEGIKGHYNSSLLYIGMSRASAYLTLLMKESVRADLKENMSKVIQGGNYE